MTVMTASSGLESFFQLISVLCIFLFVLAITYFVTKWIAKYQKGMMAGSNRNIQVIETTKVAANKYIQILQIGETYVAVAVGKDEVTFLTKLSSEELQLPKEGAQEPGKQIVENFQDILTKIKDRKDT